MPEKPHDHAESWDKSDVRWLIKLRKSGQTYKQISARLGRTIHAVGAKARRLRKQGVDI